MTEPDEGREAVALERARTALRDPDEEVRRAAVEALPSGWYVGGVSVLCTALGDDSWRVRKQAVERIAGWPDPDGIVPALIAALSETANVGLRNAAVEALTRIGRPAVGALVTAYEAGGEHKKMIVDALGAIADASSLPTLITALEDADENVRAAAAEAIGAYAGEPPEEVTAALDRALDREDLMTRLASLEALSRLGIPVPVARLRPFLDQPILRRAGLEALGFSADIEALPFLLDGLSDRARGVREASIVALWKMRGQLEEDGRRRVDDSLRRASAQVLEGLQRALGAEDRRVRRGGCTLLGATRAEEALPALVQALLDDEVHDHASAAITQLGAGAVSGLVRLCRDLDPELRGAVFALFPKLGAAASDPRIASLLIEAVGGEEAEAAPLAARALGELGGKEALAPLLRALDSDDREVAQAAAQALGRLGSRYYEEVRMLVEARGLVGPTAPHLCRVLGAIGRSGDEQLLLAALRSEDPDVRQAAAEALPGVTGTLEVIEALTFAIADESPAVRAAAVRALASLAGARDLRPDAVVDALIAASTDEQHAVAIAAIRALGALGNARALPRLLELCRSEQGGGIAAHAVDAVSRITRGGPREVEEVLLELVRHSDTEIVKAALRGLAFYHTDSATSTLLSALGHARWDVRKEAAQALVIVGGPRAARALRDRLKAESDSMVREALVRGLERLGRIEGGERSSNAPRG